MKKSTQVAIGGLSSALCVLLMFMTGLIPFSTYVFPGMAGIVLIAVATEIGGATALLVFIATSVLSLFIVPDRESVLLFIMLLGYYPMIKPKLERIPKPFVYLLKLVLFNVVIVAFYYATIYLLGIPDLLSDWGSLGKYTSYVAIGLANYTFFMYDYLLSKVLFIYIHWFRPRILRKIP
ncbi:MAG: hypothetical protein E7476_05105 [Ruminococcaceae bacterium]|jgi:hypothetical protein|nr:hypothetical protein [Oscillospiraceae bacterium]